MKELILTSDPRPVVPRPGIFINMPWEEYQSLNAFSKSMVGPALRSGAHLDWYIHGPRKETTSIAFGSLVDCLLLEPELFDERYVIRPETYEGPKGEVKPWNANAKVCKEFLTDAKCRGSSVISRADYVKAEKTAESVRAHPTAGPAVRDGLSQVSLVWEDAETGVLCKGRLDLKNGSSILDLKTSRDGSRESFSRDIANFGYHVQAGAYLEGLRVLGEAADEFLFVVVETSDETECPAVVVYRIEPESAVAGLYKFRRALRSVAKWLDKGVTGYTTETLALGVPQWEKNRELTAKGLGR